MQTSTKMRRQERAIAALLTEPTLAKAAQAIGVSRRTLARWMQEEEFAAQYREAH